MSQGNNTLKAVAMSPETPDTLAMGREERDQLDNTTLNIATMLQGKKTLEAVAMSPDTLDTLAMAREERDKQGSFETEISYGGEVDLHRHLNDCKKNPGHKNFVSVDQFNVDHLPSGYKDDELVKLVITMSDLTVRLSVKHVSDKRPETFHGTSKPYPCYKNKGSNMMRVGTGLVLAVQDNLKNVPCHCKDCLNSHTTETAFASIYITTAHHVVFDENEAAQTTCHLFFDRGNTPESCSGVVTLNPGSFVFISKDVKGEWCGIEFATHDLELARRLQKLINDFRILEGNIFRRCKLASRVKQTNTLEADRGRSLHLEGYTIVFDPEQHQTGCKLLVDSKRLLTIIVSHPHGCSKQVSVGYSVNYEVATERAYGKLIYTTATCPGSSGASVFVTKVLHLHCTLTHCGSLNDEKEEWNFGERNISFYK